MSDHLGTPEEVEQFSLEMLKQLELHKNEKKSLRNWTYEDTYDLVQQEVKKRVEYMFSAPFEREFMEKQSVHIANYLLMLWLKIKQCRELEKSGKNEPA